MPLQCQPVSVATPKLTTGFTTMIWRSRRRKSDRLQIKIVPANCLQVTLHSVQYGGQWSARQLRLTSPFAPLICTLFTYVVGVSTRMRRAPWQHVLAVGETAPAFPATIPFHNCPITNHGSISRPLVVIHASPNVECATLLRVLKTAASHSFIENSLQTT